MPDPRLKELDGRILSDKTLGPSQFSRLIQMQRDLGLVFGDRPTCPFLRPHIIGRAQYDDVSRAARTIAFAFEKLVAAALRDDELLAVLGLTARETELARIDPGYSRLCVSSRLDAHLSEDGFQFLEYNAETPAGPGDQMQLEKVLFEIDQVKELLANHPHWRPEPHTRLLQALLDTYREWGGDEERPQIAIVDWEGVSTEGEFRILRDFFVSEGYETIIADPRSLTYDGQLKCEAFRIDILYKRVVIHEFLERGEADHPLTRAYAAGRVCMINSFRSKVAHKKGGFAILTDPAYEDLFTPEEIDVCRRYIPWTRRVGRYSTVFENQERELIDIIERERERLVLKPNDDYGGHGVFLGWDTSEEDWAGALARALERPYVVQQRVPLRRIPIPTFSGGLRLEEMFVDFNPFLFNNEVEGALIRLSSSALLNVTAGGGQTALLVLEDM